MPIKIDFLANVRDFLRGTKDVDEALDDVADALDDVARDGDKSVEKLERSFRELSRRAKTTADDVDDIGDRGAGGFRKLGDAGEEVSGELKQNLGETFSSFRGDLEDLPQIAQDVFGGLAGSVGSLPAAFGLAAGAAGVGLLVAAFQGLAEQEEERKARVAEWAQAYIDAAAQIHGSVTSLAAVEAIYTDPEKYAEAEKAAKNWGVSVSTAVNAMAGDSTALTIVQGNLARNSDEVAEALDKVGGNSRGLSYEMRVLKDETNQGKESYAKLTAEMAEGEKIAQNYASSLYNLALNTGTATGEVDDLGNKIYALPDGTEVVINAQTGKAYSDVDALEKKTVALPDGDVAVKLVDNATREMDRLVGRLSGREIKIGTRLVRPGGGGDF